MYVAPMAELVDALDSKSSGSDIVSVRFRFGAPNENSRHFVNIAKCLFIAQIKFEQVRIF